MKYVLYHSSITNDNSPMERLRKHVKDGEIIAEFYDDLSTTIDNRHQQKKALQKCRETGATLLILDLSVIQNIQKSKRDDIQVKRLN